MSQLFHRSANSWAKASLLLVGGIVGVGALVFYVVYNSPYVTEHMVTREQPIPFSHKHHVTDLGIDCRFCHGTVESSPFAGIPPVKTCMTCHSQIWTHAPMLEPVREAYRTGQPIRWNRVNWVPDYVYFNHSIHVAKGVACVTCHGPVGDMPLTWKAKSLQMRWCLECHRNPAKFVRPPAEVFSTTWKPTEDQKELGEWLVKTNHIKKLTDCYTCHH
jgi:hypothetical protein